MSAQDPIPESNVGGALRSALGGRVQSHTCPVAGLEGWGDGVLLDMVNEHALGGQAGVLGDHIQDHARAFVFVLEVRGVYEDQLAAGGGQVEMLLEDRGLVGRIFVKADFADAQDVRTVEDLGDRARPRRPR